MISTGSKKLLVYWMDEIPLPAVSRIPVDDIGTIAIRNNPFTAAEGVPWDLRSRFFPSLPCGNCSPANDNPEKKKNRPTTPCAIPRESDQDTFRSFSAESVQLRALSQAAI